MAESLTVKTPNGQYEILIEPGLLNSIATRAAGLKLDGRVAVVCDTHVAPLYGVPLVKALPNAVLITMPEGEQHKTLDTVSKLYADFIAAGLDRHSSVIALGGGVVGDTAGFAAATYMRGVRLVQIPTSLLAMVDSSVGGKVGVDLAQGKNLVGAFKQPDMVLIDTAVLLTLSERQHSCGMAEIIKHGLIGDPGLLDDVTAALNERNALDDKMMNPPAYFTSLPAIVRRAVQVKIDVVEQDPYEHNIRAHLNLGHTFGHAIEQVTGYQWLHGEAVGAGLVAAARLSQRLNKVDSNVVELVERLVDTADLPTRIGNLDPEALVAAMGTDKKWRSGKARFVLLEGIGKPVIADNVDLADVVSVLDEMKGTV